jgi:hypothetical protein
VTTRDFRIKVRGVFEQLSDQQRAELLAAAPQHDLFGATFTPEGHLSYDLAARPFFTFRFAESGENDEDLAAASDRAESAARAWLDGRGLGYRLVQTQAEDLSKAPLSKRQRRDQR